mgnify:CR=1 FL=1
MKSRAQSARFGLKDPAEAAGRTDFDFFTREHAEPALRDEQEIIRTGNPIVGKVEKETWPDGKVTWVDTSKLPLRDQGGKIIGLVGIGRDITKRKQVEETLDQERRLLRTLIDNLPDYIFVKDTVSRFVLNNAAHLKHLGIDLPVDGAILSARDGSPRHQTLSTT